MNYELLNEMIDYIEDNLTEEIEIKELSKIMGVSVYSLQRIFTFLNGISINDYIKQRRLSRAYEDIKNTDDKILNIALKFNYHSATSFNRAFKNYFKITPTECRKSETNYKLFPKLYFNYEKNNLDKINYEIVNLNKKLLYCYTVSSKNYNDILYKIRRLYENVKKKNEYEKMLGEGLYGTLIEENDKFFYYLGTCNKRNLKTFEIKEGKYALFNLKSKNQEDISKFESNIYKKFFSSTNYKIKKSNFIELYEKDGCKILIAIE